MKIRIEKDIVTVGRGKRIEIWAADVYEKMKEYVADGGRLILSVAHLNTQDKRGVEIQLLNE